MEDDTNFINMWLRNPYLWVYAILAILFVLQLALNVRGLQMQWYQELDTTNTSSLVGSVTSWIIVYILSFIGFFYLYLNGIVGIVDINFLVAISIIILLLTIYWDIVFFYQRDILISFIVYFTVIILTAWFIYIVWLVSPAAALLQIPLLLRSLYILYQNIALYLDNPQWTSLRPIF